MKRRNFLAAAVSPLAYVDGAFAQIGTLEPFEISLTRDESLSVTLGLNSCVLGKLNVGTPTLSNPIPGFLIGETLELPYRNELTEISCIKPGTYAGFVREDNTSDGRSPGWRIQLEGTKQLAIQIHKGNELEHTRGCVLLGSFRSGGCSIAGSSAAMTRLKELYGSNNKRPIVFRVLR